MQKAKLLEQRAAQKIGEVLAFEEVGIDTLEKGQDALAYKLGKTAFSAVLKNYHDNLDQIRSVSNSQIDILEKAEATMGKLEKMRKLYLAGEWDDATELLEWLGFFEGAAIVHWSLVNGIAKEKGYKELAKTSAKILNFHTKFLSIITSAIQK